MGNTRFQVSCQWSASRLKVLFRENRKRLQGVAKAVTKNPFDAGDAVQNVLLKLLERGGVPASYCRNPKARLTGKR
jgi:DNA-directed RNA polymerase specialized sigma24 family protein